MPRPKRTKIISAKPAFPRAVAIAPTTAAARATSKQFGPPSQVADIISSDSDGIVRKRTTGRQQYDASVGGELLMHGGLGEVDGPRANASLNKNNARLQWTETELRGEDTRATKRRSGKKSAQGLPWDGAKARTSASQMGNSRQRPVPVAATPGSTAKLRRRTNAEPLSSPSDVLSELAPGSAVRNRDTDMVERVTDSFPGPAVVAEHAASTVTAPPSAHNQPGTPSFLSMANFKRRPRQNSLLHVVQQAARDRDMDVENTRLDVDDEEPSILTLGGLSAAPSPHVNEDIPPVRTSSSRKRKRGEASIHSTRIEYSPGSSPSVAPCKVVDNSQPQAVAEQSVAPDRSQDSPSQRITDSQLAPESPPPPVVRTPKKFQAASRRSKASKEAQPESRTRRKESRAMRELSPVIATSPLSTPPRSSRVDSSDSQHRYAERTNTAKPPNPATSASKPRPKRQAKAQVVTTETLQALLPKRRQRPATRRQATDEFEILESDGELREQSSPSRHSEDDDDDADELERPGRRRRATSTSAKAPAKAKTKRPVKHAKTPGNKAITNARKASTARRTYGRNPKTAAEPSDADGNDESSGGDDENITATGKGKGNGKRAGKKSAELDKAAKKFAEVDEWEMEFESADIGAGGSSSPWR